MKYLIYLILSIALISTAYITWLYAIFSLPLAVIPAHLAIVLYGLITALILIIMGIIYLPEKFGKIVTFLITNVSFLFLISIYILSYIAKFNWNQYMSLKILGVYIKEIPHLFDSLLINLNILLPFSFIILIIVIYILFKLSNIVFLKIELYSIKIKNRKLFSIPIIFYGIIVFIPFLILFTPKSHSFQHRFIKTYQEPIVSSLFDNALRESMYMNSIENIEEFANYPSKYIQNKPNIILVICDALRSDHMSAYGYSKDTTPFISKLLDNNESIQVENAFSISSHSIMGISSILSSRYKLYLNNIFFNDILKKYGYNINFILSGDHTNFYNLRDYYGKYIDSFTDGYTTSKSNPDHNISVNDDHNNIIFNTNNFIYDGNSSFFYFHFMTAHSLGQMYPEYSIFKPPPKLNILNNSIEPAVTKTEILINKYDNRVYQFDCLLNELYIILEQKGIIDNSILIITSDHGEPIFEKGFNMHGHSVYYSDINIPLILIDNRPNSNSEYLSIYTGTQLDIAPTILDLLGLPIPSFWEGQSIFEERKIKYTYHHEREYYSVIELDDDNIYQYIYNVKSKNEEIFNLINDSTQIHNLIHKIDQKRLDNFRLEINKHFNISIKNK